MKKAFSTVELTLVLVILTVLTLVAVARINVNNASSVDVAGFASLKSAVVKESSFYLTNSRLSTDSELNNKLSDLTVSSSASTGNSDVSYGSSSLVAGFAIKIKNSCYLLRKDYSGTEPTEVWSIAESGDCSATRALSTALNSGRGETSSKPVILG